MYEKSQPPGNYYRYLQDIKDGKINKDELVYERHYLSTEEMQYIVEKYIDSYGMEKKWDSYLDLVITYLNDGGLKDKFIEAYTDNDGNYHTGYRSYETVQPIFEQFTNFLKMYNSEYLSKLLSKKLTKLLNNTINNCKDFYKFDNEETQFKASVYLGPSPSSNKECVKEYWKKQGVEINIQDRNPLLFWEMDEYGDEFENVMEADYGENWKKYWDTFPDDSSSTATRINNCTKTYSEYIPVGLSKVGNTVALRFTMDKPTSLVEIDTFKTERKLLNVVNIYDNYFSQYNGKLAYVQMVPDKRWNVVYNNLMVYDIETDETNTLTRGRNVFSPSFSTMGKIANEARVAIIGVYDFSAVSHPTKRGEGYETDPFVSEFFPAAGTDSKRGYHKLGGF